MPKRIATSLALFAPAPALALALSLGSAGWAGPVVCTTTLEAPPPAAGTLLPAATAAAAPAAAPVELTHCASVVTTPELVERRFFSYTAPFAPGIAITHQITDILGIAIGGGDGRTVMGFGFPDQTIVWDGTALQNTTKVLLEEQSPPMPWRTGDVVSGFNSSLGSGGASTMAAPRQDRPVNHTRAVRGLW
ncbi:MAG: Occludin/ELL family protein [Cyanobacteriota bacterium]|nr:Occludin/ELL family protein [Cyanobacteriota bacterium]